MRIHGSGSKGQKYQLKTSKKIVLLSEAKYKTIKFREIIKISWFPNGSLRFSIQKSEKNTTTNLKILLG